MRYERLYHENEGWEEVNEDDLIRLIEDNREDSGAVIKNLQAGGTWHTPGAVYRVRKGLGG